MRLVESRVQTSPQETIFNVTGVHPRSVLSGGLCKLCGNRQICSEASIRETITITLPSNEVTSPRLRQIENTARC
ncbi:hypothetical protein GF362_01960 [Candidatus Dojkabacteria bacterium]|nr:hypothetical protein [Candidatus Dojkabacteria bacterium]